ncbi:hypothetical protein WJX77_008474 [Trebouxia sp. C0004]
MGQVIQTPGVALLFALLTRKHLMRPCCSFAPALSSVSQYNCMQKAFHDSGRLGSKAQSSEQERQLHLSVSL